MAIPLLSWNASTPEQKKFISDQTVSTGATNPDVSPLKTIAKRVGNDAKSVVTHPLNTSSAILGGSLDVGTSAINSISKAIGKPSNMPLAGKALSGLVGSNTDQQNDIYGLSKMLSGFELGSAAVGAAGVVNPLAKTVLGNIVGGQLTSDAATLKERVKGAVMDATLGAAFHGAGKVFSWMKGGKDIPLTLEQEANIRAFGTKTRPVVKDIPWDGIDRNAPRLSAPKAPTDWFSGKNGLTKDTKSANRVSKDLSPNQIERNTPATYDTPRGNQYIPDESLPVITAKDVKTPAKNEFKAQAFHPDTGKPIAVKESVFDSKGFRPVLSDEVLPNGYTTKVNQTTGTTVTNAPQNTNSFHPDTGVPITKSTPIDVGTKGSKSTVSINEAKSLGETTITPKGTEVPKVNIVEPIKVPTEKKVRQTKSLSDLPTEEFSHKSKVENIDFYNNNKDLATKIALGEVPAPEGISTSAIHRLARNEAEGELAIKLAESPARSTYGQNLSMQNIGDRTNSLADSIEEVLSSRKASMNKKEFKASSEELKNIIRDNAPTRQEFEALIKEMSC